MENGVAKGVRQNEMAEDQSREERSREVTNLAVSYQRGGAGAEQARDALILKMYPLLKSISRQFTIGGDSHLERDDLIQEGVLGLMHALDGFQPELGYHFSTYAYHVVYEFMQMLVQKSRIVQLPVTLGKQTNKLRAIEGRLTTELGRNPSVAEIAAEAGLSAGKAATVLHTHTISAEIRVGESGEGTVSLFDRITYEDEPSIEREVELLRVHPRLEAALRLLPRRHAELLTRYFGLNGRPESFADIARDWGYSRQNIQRLAADALKKLRWNLACERGGVPIY